MPAAPSRSRALRVALRGTSIGLAALLAAAVPSEAAAAPSPGKQFEGKGGRFGLGLSLGDPMGASAKLFLHPNHAVQFDLGWAPMHHGIGTLGADYLWHPATFVSNSVLDFLPYLGFGVEARVLGGLLLRRRPRSLPRVQPGRGGDAAADPRARPGHPLEAGAP